MIFKKKSRPLKLETQILDSILFFSNKSFVQIRYNFQINSNLKMCSEISGTRQILFEGEI